jgi:hypothetical protein
MAELTIHWRSGRKPGRITADHWSKMGRWVHFFVTTPDGGKQTVARFPAADIARVEQGVNGHRTPGERR